MIFPPSQHLPTDFPSFSHEPIPRYACRALPPGPRRLQGVVALQEVQAVLQLGSGHRQGGLDGLRADLIVVHRGEVAWLEALEG